MIDGCTVVTLAAILLPCQKGLPVSVSCPGEDYTFSEPVDYYDYSVSATVGGEEVDVTDNGDGSYTIAAASVTGSIVITATKTARSSMLP